MHVNVYFTDQNIMQRWYPMDMNFEGLQMQKCKNIPTNRAQRVEKDRSGRGRGGGGNMVICLVMNDVDSQRNGN